MNTTPAGGPDPEDRRGGLDRPGGPDRQGRQVRRGGRPRRPGHGAGRNGGDRGGSGQGSVERRGAGRAGAGGASRQRAGEHHRREVREPPRPPLPAGVDPRSLDAHVRDQLRVLAPGIADEVASRLVATGQLIDDDPEQALSHALVARRLASRIPPVREAAGLAAYHAGQWQAAIGELRAYHRMTGRLSHLAVLADCERALGRPERAIDLYRTVDPTRLTQPEAVELLIVAAGARADLGQRDAAVAMLQVRELTVDEPWTARLRYAYADALLATGRRAEAREWFARAVDVDPDASTDAAERLLDLDGVVLDDQPGESDQPGEPDRSDPDGLANEPGDQRAEPGSGTS